METAPKGKWFYEVSAPILREKEGDSGMSFGLEVEEKLFEGKSEFQHVLLFQSKTYGKVLVLDGAIQLTERDQHAYQEMISHLPVLCHPNPKKVLVIGGGDGAVITQLIKHKTLEQIVLCEIDSLVIDTSKKYLTSFLPGWTDPRVQVEVRDGFQYLRENVNHFDVIIVDSSDPSEGPAHPLFSAEFYKLLHSALTDDGVICTQAESVWLHPDFIKSLLDTARSLFPVVRYAYTSIPTYPSGIIGFCVASKSGIDVRKPLRTPSEAMGENVDDLKYYSSLIHSSAFVLPAFAERILGPKPSAPP